MIDGLKVTLEVFIEFRSTFTHLKLVFCIFNASLKLTMMMNL